MKWKILTVILAVVAIGAIATTIVVTKGYRITKAPEPQVATAPVTTPSTPAPEAQPSQPEVIPTTPAQTAPAGKAETKTPAPTQPKAKEATNVKVETKTIPAGTKLEIALANAVSSKDAQVGDKVEAKTTEALVVDGVVLAPEGSAIAGKVTDAMSASKSRDEKDRARLNLVFSSLSTIGGSQPIHGTLLGGEKKAGSTTGRDAAIIVGSGAAGAVLGKVIGKTGKATAAGGVVGAAAGMGVAAMQKGNEVSLPAGTKLTIVLENPVEVAVKK